MKKIFVFSLAIAGIVLAGCNKEATAPVNGNVVRIAASSAETVTKAYGSAQGRFYWEKNDKLGVWTGSELTEFTIGTGWDGMTYAEFEGTLPSGGAINADSFAIYPYDNVSVEGTTVTLPGYAYWTGDYPVRSAYLYSNTAPTLKDEKLARFHFEHMTAYFRLTFKNVPVSAKNAFVECWCPNATGNNKYFLMGGTFDLSTKALTPEVSDWFILKLPDHDAVIETLTVILPIVPGTYGDGAKFRFQMRNGSDSEMDGFNFYGFLTLNPNAGDFYVFPAITCPNEKSADDTGTGVNDGIEDPVVNEQVDSFWKIG